MSHLFQAVTLNTISETHAERLVWQEHDQSCSITWHSENQTSAPKKICQADDRISADHAYKLICEGCALLWRGDFHQAKQMLQALSRRIDKKQQQRKHDGTLTELFHKHRQAQAQKARILGMILIPVNPGFSIPLRRAPDVSSAFAEVFDASYSSAKQRELVNKDFAIALRELVGLIGAHEWRKNGVMIPELREKIHPYFGVFSPVRGEYLSLIKQASLSQSANDMRAFDIGTGTGVISAILAQRGIPHITATELDSRALACATENIKRLGIMSQVKLVQCDLFPEGRADLIVCNPPWLPVKPATAIEFALYDENSKMLRRFLNNVKHHLNPNGEIWLIMSDLAEHLGLRHEGQLSSWFEEAGLCVKTRLQTQPKHQKSQDQSDPLFAARSKEVTSLWCLQTAR